MRIDDVRRLDLGSFTRPMAETGTRSERVERLLAYVVRTPAGVLLLDTGMGDAGSETEAWYRPQRIPIEQALHGVGLTADDVDVVVNCHLHFDHVGANPLFARRPILAQRTELATARSTPDYTVPHLVDFAGATYELLDGEHEIAEGVAVIPTPGHVDGHQSVVLRCDDGTVILAGQTHETAAQWAADRTSPWLPRLLAMDPRRVLFAHDATVWTPPQGEGGVCTVEEWT
ncbi:MULTISPECIES: MBL fold metallo-hydrolase [Nocardioides]|nr:MBL fold metallo-hydrolase [Nocardioides sp. CGMCC 1.13656]